MGGMTEPILVALAGDLDDDAALVVPRSVTGWGDDIAVFRSDGAFYALDDTCTHERASLAEGWIEDGEVECPKHATRFSLCTGAVLCLPATKPTRTHVVEVRGTELWLHPGVPVSDAVRQDD